MVMAVAVLVCRLLNGSGAAMVPLTQRHQHARISAQRKGGEQNGQ
jgi:hypothetical protein